MTKINAQFTENIRLYVTEISALRLEIPAD